MWECYDEHLLARPVLLAGTLTLPWRVHCAKCDVQRHSACGNHSGLIVKAVPGYCEKPFAFPPELLFTFSPESCSPSPRNAFHVHPGIAFTLLRNRHLQPCREVAKVGRTKW